MTAKDFIDRLSGERVSALSAALLADERRQLRSLAVSTADLLTSQLTVLGMPDDSRAVKAIATKLQAAESDDDDGCPKGDPECLASNGDCHDACETPEEHK